jgi:hypothetical protein
MGTIILPNSAPWITKITDISYWASSLTLVFRIWPQYDKLWDFLMFIILKAHSSLILSLKL